MNRSKGTAKTQGVNPQAAQLQKWLGAAGAAVEGAPCPYPRHRGSDWRKGTGPVMCGICHPPARGVDAKPVG